MRTWGRITNADGTKTWVEVSTGPDGLNQEVYVTWLAQVLKLNLGEPQHLPVLRQPIRGHADRCYVVYGIDARLIYRGEYPPATSHIIPHASSTLGSFAFWLQQYTKTATYPGYPSTTTTTGPSW